MTVSMTIGARRRSRRVTYKISRRIDPTSGHKRNCESNRLLVKRVHEHPAGRRYRFPEGGRAVRLRGARGAACGSCEGEGDGSRDVAAVLMTGVSDGRVAQSAAS